MRDAAESAQLLARPLHGRLGIRDVELHDLVAGDRAGVRDVDADLDRRRTPPATAAALVVRFEYSNVEYDRPYPNG